MSIRNLISVSTNSVANGISAVANAGSLLTNWVQDEHQIREATSDLGVERRITSAFLDHAKWKKELTNNYDAEVLSEAKAMMQQRGLEF